MGSPVAEGFAVSVERWVAMAKSQATEAFREIGLAAAWTVKEHTPVVTGNLRANWVDLLNDAATPVPGGAPPVGMAIAQAQLGDVIHIVNPVPYALRVEFGFVGTDSLGRHYNQPGRGMVAQTLAEMPQIAEEAVRRVSRDAA